MTPLNIRAVLTIAMLAFVPSRVFAAPFVPPQIGIDQKSFYEHRIDKADDRKLDDADGRDNVRVRVEIDARGVVTSTRVRGEGRIGSIATATIRNWRFRPFTWRGAPVGAVADIDVPQFAVERQPPHAVPFPPIGPTWAITLVRSACFGSCPDYQVTVHGSGEVVFETDTPAMNADGEDHRRFNGHHVLLPGRHVTRIAPERASALLERFKAANFFGLSDRYVAQVSDNPTYQLSFVSGEVRKSVIDYAGSRVHMPPVVRLLQDEVDAVADSARWIRGTGDAADALLAEGVKLDARLAHEVAALEGAPEAFILRLIDAGLPLDVPPAPDMPAPEKPGAALLSRSWIEGQPALFAKLDALGWTAGMNRKNLDFAFALGAACDAGVARRLVALGAAVDARTWKGRNALMNVLLDEGGRCQGHDTAATVAALIALGIDVNAVDEEGESALFFVRDLPTLDLLLKAGARADIHSKAGRSPALAHSESDQVVLALLEAGADPDTTGEVGETLKDQMIFAPMPGTASWLARRAAGQ